MTASRTSTRVLSSSTSLCLAMSGEPGAPSSESTYLDHLQRGPARCTVGCTVGNRGHFRQGRWRFTERCTVGKPGTLAAREASRHRRLFDAKVSTDVRLRQVGMRINKAIKLAQVVVLCYAHSAGKILVRIPRLRAADRDSPDPLAVSHRWGIACTLSHLRHILHLPWHEILARLVLNPLPN